MATDARDITALLEALEKLRSTLLDLTGRNRLLNFKHTAAKSIQFCHSDIDATFNALVANGNRVLLVALPEPPESEHVEVSGRTRRPDNRKFAESRGINGSYDLDIPSQSADPPAPSARLQTLFYADELGAHGRKLDREARLAIEETGSNMLHLVVGFLEYTDRPGGETLWLAPLLSIPVAIERTEGMPFPRFHLAATGEELAANLSLREKLLKDYDKFRIPEYDPESEETASAYLTRVAEAVKDIPQWRVRRMMTLTLLSFSNMLLLRELEPQRWPDNALENHPLVQQLLAGKTEHNGADYASEHTIDDHPRRDIPLVYDADSSQHSALIDVLEGHSRVIEGPPGTGKSQTITNLIAAALSEGKKVLFVAEKLAALEVVKSRLTRAGLGSFVLELHSTKSNKKEFLSHLAARDAMRPSPVAELNDALHQAERRHTELRAYAEAMNSVLCNAMGLTVHQVLWRAERRRLTLGEHAAAVQELDYFAATGMDATAFEDAMSRLEQLGKHFSRIGTYGPAHPLWGFHPTTLAPEDDYKIQLLLTDHAANCDAFVRALTELRGLVAATATGISLSESGADRLHAALDSVNPLPTASLTAASLPRLFTAEDPTGVGSERVLNELQRSIAELRAAQSTCATYLVSAESAATADLAQADEIRAQISHLGIGDLAADALDRLADALERETVRLNAAVRVFAKTADFVGMRFWFDAEPGRRIFRLADLASQATTELLAFRHDGLKRPNAADHLAAITAERQRLTMERERLEKILYLDEASPDKEVAAAIRVLRAGDAWYRFLQPTWRKAIRLHRTLSRHKGRRRAAERQAELESFAKLARDQAAWSNDPILQTLAGPHYAGDKTPLDKLLAAARWTAAMQTLADEIGVPVSRVTERETLQALAQDKILLQRAAKDIQAASEAIQAALHGIEPLSADQQTASPLERLQHRAQRTATAARAAAAILKTHCRGGTPARFGLDAVVAGASLHRQKHALASNADARDLLGDLFLGPNTELSPLLAAHSFGRRVKQAGVSPAIERLLLSADAVTNHEALTRLIAQVKAGWVAWRSFCQQMTRFGEFAPDQWVESTSMKTSEFAEALRDRASRAVSRVSELLPWAQYAVARSRALELGLNRFVDTLERTGLPPALVGKAFAYRFYASIAATIFKSSETFSQFSSDRHDAVRQEFAALDKRVVQLRGQHIANSCIRRADPPDGNTGTRVNQKTEMRLLQHLFPQQQPKVPVRQILQRAGRSIQELMPCFMMGPQAVAQFLEPGSMAFDIVIMDEASQLPPAQAIGAIARGKQLVVVGDPKQLPPTSFFTSMATPADGLAVTDAESILDICISQFRPTRQLRWHYRSQHHSLIAFSNQKFYDGKLIVFPSPHEKSRSLGVSYHYVQDGIYQERMNKVEAKRIVDAAVEHILTRPGDSLGIVTLNIQQRDLVADLLDERLRSLPEAQAFREHWAHEGVHLFVKNLETVQGDERDCILVSTTFGKAPGTNVVRQHFGPISLPGGWRRLNVLFTRARKAIGVYSSLRPEDIISDANTPVGTRSLRSYLEFARDGVITQQEHTDLPPESDFEVAVIDTLRRKGYEVTPQLGVAGFRIDIAVKHPHAASGYLAAIECDGATYHSGVSVRDRDRIRQEILESLGWRDRIWRIWSTDWFRNPQGEAKRLFAFLERLASQPLPSETPPVQAPAPETAQDGFAIITSTQNPSSSEGFLFDSDEEDLAIKPGDSVALFRADNPQEELLIRVTDNVSDLGQGLVSMNDDFGAALIDAVVGELVVVRSTGKVPRSYVVKEIHRG
jgi:hypothetical protein